MATLTKIPPKPDPPKYNLELDEAEVRHLRSVLGRVRLSDLKNALGEDSGINGGIYAVLSNEVGSSSGFGPLLVNQEKGS